MLRGIRSRLSRYGIAVLAVAIAVLIKLLLAPVTPQGETPFLLFFAALMASSVYGGMGSGVLATVLAALVSNYFFLEPYYSFAIVNFGQGLRLGIFVLEGLLIARTIGSLKRVSRRAQLSQEALSESEERYRLLIDTVDYAIFRLEPDGSVASWNKGAQSIKGYRLDEIIGRHFSLFYPEEDIQQGKPERQLQVAATEGRFEDEGWRVRKDGSRFWANVVITALRDEAGNLKGFSKVTRDISDRKRTEEALRESEKRFRKLAEKVSIIPWEADASTGNFTYVGPQAVDILGYPLSDWYADNFWVEHIHSEDRESALKYCLDTSASLDNYEFEYRMLTADGRVVWLYDIVNVVRGEKGPQLLRGFLIDITARKQAEEGLRKSEERYRAFIGQSSEGIWRFELEQPISTEWSEDEQIQHFYQHGYLAECNKVMAQMYGFSCAEEIVGARLADLLVQSDPHNIEYLRNFIRSGYNLNPAESHEIGKEDRPKYFLNSLVGIVENGFLVRAWGTQLDVTERKRIEAKLRLSEERFRMLLENVKDYGIFLLDTNQRVVRWGAGAENILGYQEAEILGQPGSCIFTPEDLQHGADKAELKKAVNEGRAEDERWHVRKDGSLFWASGMMTQLRDETGQMQGFAKIMRDFTERKQAEEEREQLLAREQEARAASHPAQRHARVD